MTLFNLGWEDFFSAPFAAHAAAGLTPARVSQQHKHAYELLTPEGEFTGTCTGRLLHTAATPAELPAVGDWVAVRHRPGSPHADIHDVLPRRTKFSRRAPGDGEEQVIAANVDVVFLVIALDQNFNLRRIERYLAATAESGAEAVIVLNKTDLHPHPAAAIRQVGAIAGGAAVVGLSALRDDDVEEVLAGWLQSGRTIAFLGSSGVGKSTIINRIVGAERQSTAALSDAVGKGRHTTTKRELIMTASGALLMDTPGMRELQLWEPTAVTLDSTFRDIAELARQCRFSDCSHQGEPGCAVAAAREEGALSPERWESHQKLLREQAYEARRQNPRLARENRNAWKKINVAERSRRRLEEGE